MALRPVALMGLRHAALLLVTETLTGGFASVRCIGTHQNAP
jgi:hypothetical protein